MSDFLPDQIVLEWSPDPLSDVTPTYVRVSSDEIRGIEWWAGVDREGNDPEPGGMTVRLKNVGRKWEPLYGTNTIDTEQRFRLTLGGVAEGVWFTTDFEVDYPAGTGYSEVTITCSDGAEVLALDDLPELDPPDAHSYPDVVAFDEPWGHWRLGDPAGTQAMSQVRRVWRGKGKRRRRVKIRRRWQETLSEAVGLAGPAGTYKNLPELGVPGLVVGDPDTAVRFRSSLTQWARIPLEADDLRARAFTVEAIVAPTAASTDGTILSGPIGPAGGAIWGLQQIASGNVWRVFVVVDSAPTSVTASGGTPAAATRAHLTGTWNGSTLSLYVDGSLVASAGTPYTLGTIGANPAVQIAAGVGGTLPFDGVIDEAAVYERPLSPERVLAHYQAAAERGFPQQTAGARIAAIATSDLWAETEIQTSGRNVQPQMMFGQPRLEEIAEAAHAEGPRTLFFFNGDGNPVYLGHEWQAGDSDYNTVQAVFSDDETGFPYLAIDGPVYDHETFNTVTASREGGPLVTETDTTEQTKRRRRVHAEYTDVLLAEDDKVESLAYHVLQLYKTPAKRPLTVTVAGRHTLAQIETLDIGHLIRVVKSGDTGDPVDRAVWIIGKHKTLNGDRNITCTYNLSRGFDGATETAHAGIVGYSEADTAKAA